MASFSIKALSGEVDQYSGATLPMLYLAAFASVVLTLVAWILFIKYIQAFQDFDRQRHQDLEPYKKHVMSKFKKMWRNDWIHECMLFQLKYPHLRLKRRSDK